MVTDKLEYKKQDNLTEMSTISLFGYLLIRILTDGEDFLIEARVNDCNGFESECIFEISSTASFVFDMETYRYNRIPIHEMAANSRIYTVKIYQLDDIRNPLFKLSFANVRELVNGILNNIGGSVSSVSPPEKFNILKLIQHSEDFIQIKSVEKNSEGLLVISLKNAHQPEFIKIK